MKAKIQPDGSIALAIANELRIISPLHEDHGRLCELIHEQMHGIDLSAARAPKGYTQDHPLVIQGQEFYGGQWIPSQVMAQATTAEKEKVEHVHDDHPEEFRLPEGYGGHPWIGGTPESGKVYNVPMEHIHADPERFQYKQGTNKKGVTDQFAGVQFDPRYGGVLSVWKDPKNGKTYVVNGHHRFELAQRSGIETYAVRYMTGAKTAAEARAEGALINIAGGKGTALDAAKFMRDSGKGLEDFAKENINVKGQLAKDAGALSVLNDRLFSMVARGQMKEQDAVAIGRHLANHNMQDQLANFLAKKEEAGKEYTPKVIEDMAKEMAATPTTTRTEHTLFGDLESEDSLFGERNELKAAVRNDLAKAVNDSKAVSSTRRAGVVGAAGNVLDVEANKKIAGENSELLGVFDTLVNRKGVISDALNAGAEDYAKATGKKAKDEARARTIESVRAAIAKESANGGAIQPSREGSEGAHPGGAGELPRPTGDGERDSAKPDGLTAGGPMNREDFGKLAMQVRTHLNRARGIGARIGDANATIGNKDKLAKYIKPLAEERDGIFKMLKDAGMTDRIHDAIAYNSNKTDSELYDGLFGEEKHESKQSSQAEPPKPAKNPTKNKVKSLGHVAYVGNYEYYRGERGLLYKATIGSKISNKTGNRVGNITGEAEMEKFKLVTAERERKRATIAAAGETPKPTPTVNHGRKNEYDGLEGSGREGEGRALQSGEQLAGDASQAHDSLLPGSREGTGEGLRGLPGSDDVRGDGFLRGPGKHRDADRDGRGDGSRTPANQAAGRDREDATLRDGGGSKRSGAGDVASIPPSPAERSKSEPATPENPTDLAAGNFRYGEMNFKGVGAKTKFKQNIEAIRTLRNIEIEGRTTATPAEQEILAKYVGWGAFPAIFKTYGDAGFDPTEMKAWSSEAKLLQSMLPDDDWKKARGSILNAHYTHPDIVKLHWDIAKRLGFDGGKFLETSAGIGYYLGMIPPDMASRTAATAVELDTTTGKMLQLLYPSANVQIKGFEKHRTPNNFYDLVASNVPFGDYKVHDDKYNKHDANIHDYFFLKSLDVVRPGGLVMHITSAGTMDKGESKIREELAKQCDLVSAIRFPGGAHKENAGTEVVTDMLILRKRAPGEKPSGPAWMNTVAVPCPVSNTNPNGGESIPVNEYFAKYPEQILGRLDRTGSMYSDDEKNVTRTDDYEECLAAVIERLPKNIMTKPKRSAAFEPESLPAPGDVRPGGFSVKGGNLYRHEEGVMVQQKTDAKTISRIQGHMDVRDAARQVINDQKEGRDASESRDKLNEVYDAFVEKFGYLNDQTNRRSFRADPDSPLMRALENWDNDTETATKADMFRKDTIRRAAKITKVDTITGGLAASLQEHGRIDLDYIGEITGKGVDHAKRELIAQGLAFDDPENGFTTASLYLSGNVRQKLVLARAAAEADKAYQVNVDALMKVQPEDVDYTEIHAKLGAAWVPAKDVADFAATLLSGNASDFDIRYIPETAEWKAEYTNSGKARYRREDSPAKTSWGAEMEDEHGSRYNVADFIDILRSALSGKSITIKKEVPSPDGESTQEVVNVEATEACRAKVQELKDTFSGEQGSGWIWEDDERRERLHRFYNDNFNNIRQTHYDGSHLTFPGMNPDIKLHPHIPNFVWQTITTGRGLAAHEVGTGKTYTMIASAMELRRLGMAKKPCIACLKANVEAITADVLKLYPGAKVLSTADMFTADKRKKTTAQIATGDYDIIIMTHDNMNMLPMSPETNAKYIGEELAELRAAKQAAMKDDSQKTVDRGGRRGGGKRNDAGMKALEKAEKNLEAKLEAALSTKRKDDAVYFEDLGIDQIFVDEAHVYKTLPVYTKRDRVKGIPTGRSQRATSMLMRTRWLQEHHKGRGVVFATGTPVSNTMAELYTMQRYLQPDVLKERGLDKFDAWANMFGDEVTRQEVSVTGKYKSTTRFAKFVNIPELMQMAREVIDVQRADDIKLPMARVPEEARPTEPNFTGETQAASGKTFKWVNGQTNAITRPNRKDHVIIAPHSPAIAGLMTRLQERAEALKNVKPWETKDNMLVICTDGRKGALDMRLVDPSAEDDPESKTNQAIQNILKLAKERPGQTQLIFSDVGVNPMKAGEGGQDDDEETDLDAEKDDDAHDDATTMHWYGDVINKLVAGGIPREKIADFSKLKGQAKEDAQAALRRGDMVIGIGSTQKMGTGVNVQDRITAMHHLDVPWVPAAIEQRDGRGWRHGNQNKDVEVYRYVTEGSLDQMFWQVVGTKAKFISQVMNPGHESARQAVNQDTEQLSPEQLAAAASGDPRILEKVNLEDDIKQLHRAMIRHEKEQTKFKKAEGTTSRRIDELRRHAKEKHEDAKTLAEKPDFHMAIGGDEHTEKEAGVKAYHAALAKADDAAPEVGSYSYARNMEQDLGTYRGMDLVRKGYRGKDVGAVFLRTPNGHMYPTTGTLGSIEAIANRIEKKYPGDVDKDVENAEKDLANTRANIGKKWTKHDELAAKQARVKEIEDGLKDDDEDDTRTKAGPKSPRREEADASMSLSSVELATGGYPVSAAVKAEAVRLLREMFPLSDYNA